MQANIKDQTPEDDPDFVEARLNFLLNKVKELQEHLDHAHNCLAFEKKRREDLKTKYYSLLNKLQND